jgi:hypothetical protein
MKIATYATSTYVAICEHTEKNELNHKNSLLIRLVEVDESLFLVKTDNAASDELNNKSNKLLYRVLESEALKLSSVLNVQPINIFLNN